MKSKPAVAPWTVLCCLGLMPLSPWTGLASEPASPIPPTLARVDDGGRRLAVGDLTGAIRSLRSVLHTEPGNAEATHLLIVACLRAGQLSQAAGVAEAETNRPSIRSEERATAALLLGTARYGLFAEKMKDANRRIASFASMRPLLEQMAPHPRRLPSGDTVIDPGDDGLQSEGFALGSSLKSTIADLRQTLTQAETAFRMALTVSPHLPGAHDGLGLVRAAQGYVGEAHQEFLTEIAKNGPNGSVYLHLAEADLLQHQDEEALKYLGLATALSPDLEAAYRDFGMIYEGRKDRDRAQWAKGMCALRRGDLHGAEAAFAKHSQKSSEILCAKAELAIECKRSEEARSLLNQARVGEPGRAEVLLRLGQLEASLGRSQEAIAFYRQALEIDPACFAAWYGLGLAYDALQDRESAVSDFRQALLINPNDPSARLHLGNDEAELGQDAESAADFTDYLRRFPTASDRSLVLTALTQNQAH